MAQKIVTTTVSDLSGQELVDGEGQTIHFSVGSNRYSMDVSDKEAGEFFDALKRYTDVASKVAGREGRSTTNRTSHRRTSAELSEIRAWARGNGFEVGDRGRVPTQILDAYQAAH